MTAGFCQFVFCMCLPAPFASPSSKLNIYTHIYPYRNKEKSVKSQITLSMPSSHRPPPPPFPHPPSAPAAIPVPNVASSYLTVGHARGYGHSSQSRSQIMTLAPSQVLPVDLRECFQTPAPGLCRLPCRLLSFTRLNSYPLNTHLRIHPRLNTAWGQAVPIRQPSQRLNYRAPIHPIPIWARGRGHPESHTLPVLTHNHPEYTGV